MRVLVADDEKNIRETLCEYLRLEGFDAEAAQNGLSARKLLSEKNYDAAVLDLRMPGMTGIELLDWIDAEGPSLPVIMISAYGEIQDAVAAMKKGAYDYIVKPFDASEIVLKLRRAVEQTQLKRLVRSGDESGEMAETRNPGMRQVLEILSKAAPTDATILITGESGTGKELLARRAHALSFRRNAPFVPVNLGGIPETLMESELFGYERGAFTGADRRKEGLFEAAAGGTLFLDEIGDMPLHLQVKLLRVLQDRKIQRLGSTAPLPVDVRILAATNRDLARQVREGLFREDLFYRLNVIHIEAIPLRDRPEDIPLLVGFILEKIRGRSSTLVRTVSTDALHALMAYSFPGNVRELENILERAAILAESDTIRPRDLNLGPGKESVVLPPPPGSLEETERRTILATLHRNEWKKTVTAAELGISRRTLLNKINQYGLERDGA